MRSSDPAITRPTGSARAIGRGLTDAGILCADNLELMSRLEGGCCGLIYADPPFDLAGSLLEGGRSPRRSRRRSASGLADYLAFLRPRFAQMHRLLSDCGSLYVHLDCHIVHYVKVMLDEVFGAGNFLNEIIWSYRSGGRPSRWFPRKHDTILLYAKRAGRHTFNRLHAGEYRTQDLRMSDDGRPYKSTRNGPIYFNPAGPAVSDVWDIPFLSTVSKERTRYPSQKPESLLERIILASSNEGDLVADFFCGSGTTLVAAKRLARRWLGCDINRDAVAIAEQRLRQTGRGRPPARSTCT